MEDEEGIVAPGFIARVRVYLQHKQGRNNMKNRTFTYRLVGQCTLCGGDHSLSKCPWNRGVWA